MQYNVFFCFFRHYEPLLPDYMVHKEYAPHGDNHRGSHQQRRNPLTKDNTSVFEREGNSATNKTIRIQEAVPNGYGVSYVLLMNALQIYTLRRSIEMPMQQMRVTGFPPKN